MSDHRRKAYWCADMHFDECPRCGGMAEALPDADGQPCAIRCTRCQLLPTHMSVWDEETRAQVYLLPLTHIRLEELIAWVRLTNRSRQIWEGDVLVAHWSPERGVTYFNGRCGE